MLAVAAIAAQVRAKAIIASALSCPAWQASYPASRTQIGPVVSEWSSVWRSIMANVRALRRGRFLLTALYLAAGVVTVAAGQIATARQATAFPAVCDSGEPAWTARERWVWGQVCRRRPADLRGGANRISAEFLEAILLDEPYRSALHSRVEIVGADFPGALDLSGDVMTTSLLLDRGHFGGPVYFNRVDMRGVSLAGARFDDALSFEDAKIAGSIGLQGAITKCINLSGADVGNSVFLRGLRAGYGGKQCTKAFQHGDIRLIHTRVALDIDAGKAKAGPVDGSRLDVRGDIRMTDGVFGPVKLAGAQVAGTVDLTGSSARDLEMSDIAADQIVLSRNISGDQYVGPRPVFGDVSLSRAHLRAGLALAGVRTGNIDASDADVAGDV
ncbi:MAG TPA: pentapeptide repeat-containing protein, partial [Candidatus Elarobacter sp.]|nr:pentapeptide repeat-containing protein [Candidatus Elarobacter sp.]